MQGRHQAGLRAAGTPAVPDPRGSRLTFVAGLPLVPRQVTDAHEVIPGLDTAAVVLTEVGGAPGGTESSCHCTSTAPAVSPTPRQHPHPSQYLSVIPQTLKNTLWYCATRCSASSSTSTGSMSTFSICRQPWKAVWLDRQPVTEAGLGQPAREMGVSSPQAPIAPDPALLPTSKEVLVASA